MDNERTADVLQVALASYDRKELRVQKNYLEEQNPVLACTCFLNGHKLLQELQQGHNRATILTSWCCAARWRI